MGSYGSKGPEVKGLQTSLMQLGYDAVKATGEFDVRTDEAVRHLQRSFGYDVDGTDSPATQALIKQQLGYRWDQRRSAEPLVVLARGHRGDDVRRAQADLAALGYGDVPQTGQYEVRTHEAVRHLQGAFGYVVDGVVGAAVRKLLAQQVGYGWRQQSTPVPLRVLTPGCSGDDVLALQRDLRTLGYAGCEPTGTFDGETEDAVRDLQRSFGYSVDGLGTDAVRFLVRQQLVYGWSRRDKGNAVSVGEDFWKLVDGVSVTSTRVPFAPVRTQYYGHGAFMGATTALLSDAKWRRILAFLMPDVFEALRAKLAEGSDACELVPMMENNPVLAAFGTVGTARASGRDEHANHLVGLEWDLFVDSALIEARAEAATSEERDAVMDRVIDTSLIAHGGAADTVLESLGLSQYDDVRLTPKTQYGGVEMDSWLDLFGRALALARSDAPDALYAEMTREPRSPVQEACMLNTFERPWPVERVVREFEIVTGRPYLSVVIDIKSLASTPEFLRDLVRRLNRFGVHVAAVGSFLREEIDGVSSVEQRVAGRVLAGPREVWFFHFAGDLQLACARGRVPSGQHVMFNGASLLQTTSDAPREYRYGPDLTVLQGLEALRKRHDLRIGFYVQEGDCDATAAAALSDIMASWAETFELGFAWGGLRDEGNLGVAELARMGHGSQALLVLIGKARGWDPELTA